MSGLTIDFEIEENVSAAIGRAIAAGSDFTPAMQSIANHLATTTKLRFEREAGPDGKPWKPSQRAREEGGQTLTQHGDLKNSVQPRWGSDFAAAGPESSGGAAVYAKIHQLGGTIVPRVKKALSFGGRILAKVVIPARPYLGFDQVNRDFILGELRDHIAAAFSNGGRAS